MAPECTKSVANFLSGKTFYQNTPRLWWGVLVVYSLKQITADATLRAVAGTNFIDRPADTGALLLYVTVLSL